LTEQRVGVTLTGVLLVLSACAQGGSRAEAQAAAAPQPVIAQRAGPLRSTPAPGIQRPPLRVTPAHAVVGQPVRVQLELPGPDGCYRQSKVETKIDGQQILHSYKTWRDGVERGCTEAEVAGGVDAHISLEHAGHYRGEVMRDGALVGSYQLSAVAQPVSADKPPMPTSLYLRARVLAEDKPANRRGRVVVSRSVEAGQQQYPWLLRLDPTNTLVGGVNATGTEITICRSPSPVPWGRWTKVGMAYDGARITLMIEGAAVVACDAPGEIKQRPSELIVGAMKNVPSPGPDGPYHLDFAGQIEELHISALQGSLRAPPMKPAPRKPLLRKPAPRKPLPRKPLPRKPVTK